MAPPVLAYLGALTLQHDPDIDVQLIDANREKVPEEMDADAVGISVLTTAAVWAYRLADKLRAKGIKVILGGLHPTALPDEAIEHADSIVLGEAENALPDLLEDLKADSRLQRFYERPRPELQGIPVSRRDLLKQRYMLDSLFTARGCPHGCNFCTVTNFFGNSVRFRPIDEVVSEVDVIGRFYYNIDDNAWGLDIDRSITLFRELSKLKKRKWFGTADLASVQGPKGEVMLGAAADSGLTSIMLGFESLDEDTLAVYNSRSKQGSQRIEAIKKIKSFGIDPLLFVIIDPRTTRLDEFERILQLADQIDVTFHPVLLLPLPGSKLYADYKDFIVPDTNWSDFHGAKVLLSNEDPSIRSEDIERAMQTLSKNLFTLPRILTRVGSLRNKGFPASHFFSFMLQMSLRKTFNEEAKFAAQQADLKPQYQR